MQSWEILERAIPRAASQRVAQILGVTPDYVRRWRREPESDDSPTGTGQRSILDRVCDLLDSDDSPTGTGQRSILDRVCDLLDAVFLVNPAGSALVVNFIAAHHRSLVNAHAPFLHDDRERAVAVSELLTEAAEAVNSLNLEGCTKQTLIELVEMREAADRAIRGVEKFLEVQKNG